jgi:DNA-directed RNA polymerase specialized sigma24 family protein
MAGGETAALDQLYLRHGPPLLAYLQGQLPTRQLAEEVLQDVMLAAWQGAGNFRGEGSVRSWLLAISRNRACTRTDETLAVGAPNLSQPLTDRFTVKFDPNQTEIELYLIRVLFTQPGPWQISLPLPGK